MKTIDFAAGLSLPIEIASSPIALLAQRGRGKTRTAKKLAEAFLSAGIPPVILDPAGVWWGLRLAADGYSRGLDIPVLGGLHGDQPLVPTGGEVLAEALVRTRRPCVIDFTGLSTEADKKRFATAFAETFYRQKMKSRSPVHLFLEEADEWIPEQPAGDEARMLGAFQRIVRLGRNFGIGITMISQRPQGLSKKCLNLSEVVIALGMAGAHEKKAVKLWMDEQDVSAERRAEVLGTLPKLGWNKFEKRDHGALIWAPLLNLFGVHKVKDPVTFDSSATPEVGDDGGTAALPPLNLEDLSRAMAATVEEAKANDPRALRAEVARLKAELARAAAAVRVEERVVERVVPDERLVKLLAEAKAEARQRAADAQEAESRLWRSVDQIETSLRVTAAAQPAPGTRPVSHGGHGNAGAAGKAGQGRGAGDPSLAGGERKILTVLAQHSAGRTKVQVALLTGYAHTGGGFNNYISALRSKGFIHGRGESLQITEAGAKALGSWDPLPTGDEIRRYWLAEVGKAERAALSALIEAWPNALTKEQVASAAGYEANGGGFNNALSRLRTLELIEGRGDLRASDNLFAEVD